MNKFKVGDEVKILNCISYVNAKGIVTYHHDNTYLRVDINGAILLLRECDLELIKSSPNFKIGDFVWTPSGLGVIEKESIVGHLDVFDNIIFTVNLGRHSELFHMSCIKKVNYTNSGLINEKY